MSLLVVRDLHIHFLTSSGMAQVIEGAHLKVEEQETVALVGETGCGKSVTSKAILGVLQSPPAQIVKGEILFRGVELTALPPEERKMYRGRQIAMVPQDPMTSLNPVFTIGEQMADLMLWQDRVKVPWHEYWAERVRKKRTRQSRQRAVEMLDRVKIPLPEMILRRYPVELSGGMRQRVLIAMALLGNPSLLIADEPGTALDVSIQDQILQLLRERVAKERFSILYITHDLGVAREMCETIYVMYAGKVAEWGPIERVFHHPQHPYTVGLIESIPKLRGSMTEGIPGRIPDYDNPPAGCRFHPRCPHAMQVCREVVPGAREVERAHFVACHLY